MHDNLIHVNSKNETLDLKKLGVLVNYNELRDYEWSYSSENNIITNFEKGIVKKTIPFVFFCKESEADKIKDAFYEHFDVDVLNMSKGYFQIGDYKYYCYVTKSKKTNYLIDNRYLDLSVEITTDDADWIKESSYELVKYKEEQLKNIKKYKYSYPFVYANKKGNLQVFNESADSCDFILRIYGPCSNPFVKIGSCVYQVKTSLSNDEYLEIDSRKRTVFSISQYGDKKNLFHYRSHARSNFFEKIPAGASQVTWNGDFKAELILYQRRGEPKWNL